MTPIEEAAREWLKENMALDLRDDGEPYGGDVQDLAAFARAQRLIGAQEQDQTWVEVTEIGTPENVAAEIERLRELASVAKHKDSDALMKSALGREMWNHLWGPELEALGHVMDKILQDRDEARLAGARQMRERALHIANLALEGFYSPEDVARQIAALPDEPEPLL